MKKIYSTAFLIFILFFNLFIKTANSQVGINTANPNNLLHIKIDGTVTDGLQIENDNFAVQLLTESSLISNSLTFNNSSSNGEFNFSLSNSNLIKLNSRQFYPMVNATDNTVNTPRTVDLGIFSNHYRRVYTRGIHTNDNSVNGGLRINIGSSGGTVNDYNFSDFAFYPMPNGVKNLGRNGNFWNATYSVNYFVPSDEKLKHSIKPLENGLSQINALNTYSYVYNSDKVNKIHFGFMAQELQKVMPNLVNESDTEDKPLAVNYTELIPVLVNAVKEQNVQIEDLKAEIETLKKQIKTN